MTDEGRKSSWKERYDAEQKKRRQEREQERIELRKEIERITIEGCGTFYPLSEGGGLIPWQVKKERYGEAYNRVCSGDPPGVVWCGEESSEFYCARCYNEENEAMVKAEAALARQEQIWEDQHFERIGGCGVPDSWEPYRGEY